MKAVETQSVQTKSTQKDSSNQSNSEEAKSVHEEMVADIERLEGLEEQRSLEVNLPLEDHSDEPPAADQQKSASYIQLGPPSINSEEAEEPKEQE